MSHANANQSGSTVDPMPWPLPEGDVCFFCGCAPDGDRVSWQGPGRRRCNKVPCVLAFDRYYDRRIALNRQRERFVAKLKFGARGKSAAKGRRR